MKRPVMTLSPALLSSMMVVELVVEVVQVFEVVATNKKVLNKVMLSCRKVASEAEVVIKAEDVVVLSEEKVPRVV